MLRAIHLAAAGGATFGPAVAQRVIEFFARPRSTAPVAFPQLTDREHEILDLLAQGHPNATIAARLRISDKTVRNHVSNIFAKLAVADRSQAIVRAREAGLGGTGSVNCDGRTLPDRAHHPRERHGPPLADR